MKIKNSTILNSFIYVVIVISMFEELIYSYQKKASFLFYIPEVILILTLFLVISYGFYWKYKYNFISSILALFYIGYAVISCLWSDASVYDEFTRFRYVFFSILFYYIVKFFLDDYTYSKIVKFMAICNFINLFLAAYQNLVLKLNPDFCNGIFGTVGYANAATGYFCLGLSVVSVAYFIDNIWNKFFCVLEIMASCLVCAFAEVKAYYILFVICVVLMILIRKNTLKEKLMVLRILLIICAILYIAWIVLSIIFPYNLRAFQSLAAYKQYDGRNDYAGRLNTLQYIYSHLFNNNFWDAFWGNGLGSECNNYIYELGKTFSDLGVIGVSLLGLFLGSIFTIYITQKEKTSEALICSIMAIGAIVSIVIWNCTFTRFSYIFFFFLAISDKKYK